MRIISDVRTTTERFPNIVLTVGCFDGVHRGHRQILKALVEEAEAVGGTPAVMTLEPHPRQYFFPENVPNILTNNSTKYRLLEACGVETLYVLPFDDASATLSAQRFVESIIAERCNAVKIIVGHDFAFGNRAEGDYNYLLACTAQYGFEVMQIPPLIIRGQRVSSTLIRERVVQGEVENLKEFLGRDFSVSGKIIPGRGIGRILGFPTANLDIACSVVPAHGVYVAEAIVQGTSYIAAVNIGIAPTIRDEHPLVEAHLLDFEGILEEEEMEVILHKRLRTEKKFSSREELVAAIASDVQQVRDFFQM
ncbi:MAG: bifunctional riboflavin kinase/FAD synthetase [Candidatus Hydrogenedentes bacterium]|nr:bifunctional riboflavin kinase/FAD synthetase [Candidatus Hydrogenedentota bacterium]